MGRDAAKASVPGVVLSQREKGWLSQSPIPVPLKGQKMKISILRTITALAVSATLAATSFAATTVQSFDDITYWVGSGSNRAALVIDWNDGSTTESYAWGFRWNGTATGADMLRAIAGFIGTNTTPATPDGTGDPALTLFIQTFPGFGETVFQWNYLEHAQGGFEPDAAGFWGYYVADGSSAFPDEWAFAETGMEDRQLSNNDWDGWSWAPDFDSAPPDQPVAAVPEPSVLVLFALGAGGLVWYRRNRHA